MIIIEKSKSWHDYLKLLMIFLYYIFLLITLFALLRILPIDYDYTIKPILVYGLFACIIFFKAIRIIVDFIKHDVEVISGRITTRKAYWYGLFRFSRKYLFSISIDDLEYPVSIPRYLYNKRFKNNTGVVFRRWKYSEIVISVKKRFNDTVSLDSHP
jgi:hypothetical protein